MALSEVVSQETLPQIPVETHPNRANLFGPVLCLAAAMLYAGTNMALRRLAEPGQAADPLLVLFVKELVTVLVVGPWLVWQVMSGRIRLPSWGSALAIIAVGIPTQVVGNLGMIWAFGIVGIAIAVPVALAVNLTTAAILGRFVLSERVSARTFLAILLLIVGITILQWGANGTGKHVTSLPSWQIAIAIGMCALAGIIYGWLSVVIRRVTTHGTSGWFVLVLVTGMGVITMGPMTFWTHGWNIVSLATNEHWLWMIVSGFLNLAGFWALTRGLQWTPVARANLLTSSQAAMAALAGWVIFGEALNMSIGAGLALTLCAIVLSSTK
jgi:drug/metabolite transporter (DMT)-like permease